MKKYSVEVQATVTVELVIEAKSKAEAERIARASVDDMHLAPNGSEDDAIFERSEYLEIEDVESSEDKS